MSNLKRILTRSGAVYLYDAEGKRIQRVSGPLHKGIMFPNGQWHPLRDRSRIAVGERMYFAMGVNKVRLTTEVVSVEEVDE